MGRGLSDEQKAILAILPPYHPEMTSEQGAAAPNTREIIAALGLPDTKATQTSVSRSIRRLTDRGMVWHTFAYRGGRQHFGRATLTPEQGAWIKERSEQPFSWDKPTPPMREWPE